jgi:Tol biopolymer transport system component
MKMVKSMSVIIALLTVLWAIFYAADERAKQTPPKDNAPGSALAPKLFAEGIINTSADEYGPTFTPDGRTLYFVRRVSRSGPEFIMVSHLSNDRWSEPKMAEFSGQYFDKEPYTSPDGKRLYFASQRPVSGTEAKKGRDFDLWYVEKMGRDWGSPKHLGPLVNTPGYENYPAVTADGTLYFASVREGGKGQNDLYRARLINGEYSKPENLAEINTPNTDADPYVAPDGSYMIFSSDRSGSFGEGDLYVTFNRGGKWSEPRNLGATFNTKEYEYTPMVAPGGKYFFFSRGWGEIYRIEMSALNMQPDKPANRR